MAGKRRAPADEDEEEASPEPTQTQRGSGRKRRATPSVDGSGDEDGEGQDSGHDQMVKKMIRLALACEYARIPIRRADISQKVLGTHPRQFKPVFQAAQEKLAQIFGMQMVELPQRERLTLQERRAAQKQERQSTSTGTWILTTILPPLYRDSSIIPPPSIPTSETESTYIGLYTFIIATILLSGGSIQENKLMRYLRRANADESTPIDKTDKVLQRLIREQYLLRVKDSTQGDEDVDYRVGPRGKMEVGKMGVAELVRTVFGEAAPDDLEERLKKSLDLGPEDMDISMNERSRTAAFATDENGEEE